MGGARAFGYSPPSLLDGPLISGRFDTAALWWHRRLGALPASSSLLWRAAIRPAEGAVAGIMSAVSVRS